MTEVAGELPRWFRVLSTALAIAAVGLTGLVGGAAGAVVFVLCVAVLTILATKVSAPQDRATILAAVLLAFLLRALVAGGVEAILELRSPGSVYTPDEAVYLGGGRALADHLRDASVPFDPSEPHLRMLYVQIIGIVFALIGPNVLVIKLLNSFAGALAPLLLYKAMRNARLPGARAATVVVLFFPSLLFWSTLALKDAYVELCVLGAVWTSSELLRSRNYWWLAGTALALVTLESVRRYAYFALALALLAVPFAFANGRERIRAAIMIGATVAFLFAIFDPLSDAGPNPLYLPIYMRGAGAEGAGSAFVEPFPVVRGDPGDQFVVALASPSPGASATPAPQNVRIAQGSEVVIDGYAPRGSGPYVVVHPGDILTITDQAGTAPISPESTPRIVVLNPEAKNLVGPSTLVQSDATSFTGSLWTNIKSLPVGMLFVAFAPFPWAARRLTELATIPEMLLWYPLLALAVAGLITLLRRRLFAFVHGAFFLCGMFIALSLIASTTGTMIRSRAMIVPFVVALAAVGAAMLLRDRIPLRARRFLD